MLAASMFAAADFHDTARCHFATITRHTIFLRHFTIIDDATPIRLLLLTAPPPLFTPLSAGAATPADC